MRNMLDPARLNRLDQGLIFKGGVSNICPNVPVLGVVLSARCDISQRKVDAVAYSPVIAIEDFVKRVVLEKEKEGYVKDKEEAVEQLLIASNPGLKTWTKTFGVRKVFGSESASLSDKQKIKAQSLFADIEEARGLGVGDVLRDSSVSKSIRKRIRSYVEDVAKGKIEGLFLIDNLSDDLEGWESPCIANLREIRFIDIRFLEKVAKGFSPGSDKDYFGSDVYRCKGYFYYPVSNIKSPYIELLMQKFASQFVRIGVDDVDVNEVLNLAGV